MKIDSEEHKLVEQHRLNKAITEGQLAAGHLIVSIAAQWAEYSMNTGYGLTYSEFCDGFAFDGRVDEKYRQFRKYVYEGIKRMYSVVDDISETIGKSIVNKE